MEIIPRKIAKEKQLTQYFTGKPCKHGHVAPRWVSSMSCTQCTASRAEDWRSANVEYRRNYRNQYRSDNIQQERDSRKAYYHNNKEAISSKLKEDYRNNPIKYMLYRARERAKAKNIPFDLSERDVVYPSHCPIFDFEFVIGDPDKAPSLDRLIPSDGYVKGNVQVISIKANRIKNDATVDELQRVVEFLLHH